MVETHQLWKARVLKFFTANGFSRFMTRELLCLEQFITCKIGEVIKNPFYSQWTLMDQRLASTLYTIISPSLLSYVLNLNSCTDILATIEKHIQSSNQSRII